MQWAWRLLSRSISNQPFAGQVRLCCFELERDGRLQDWQVRQADQELRLNLVNFLKRTEWHRSPASSVVDEQGGTSPLAAAESAFRAVLILCRDVVGVNLEAIRE